MPRVRNLVLEDIGPSAGRCPWRIRYRADDIQVSAFFRPPQEIAKHIGYREVSLVALPILCDLAAEVRPVTVSAEQRCTVPQSRRVFEDAVSALLVERDAHWNRLPFTAMPAFHPRLAKWRFSEKPLHPRRVVLGFSGGKDSIVSLFALLGAGYEVLPVLLNEGDRTWQDIRSWIPKLKRHGLKPMVTYLSVGRRKWLRERYGDGYFSSYQIGWLVAILALCAVEASASVICLGIEKSADESFTVVRGRKVNHQHQKTTKHLKLLERFYQRTLHPELRIASPIAEATDTEVLQVLLNHVPRSFQGFSSCGASNWSSKHCGECAKCAFVYVLLVASGSGRQLAGRIFRRDLLEDVELYRPWLDKRFRLPPACIGSKTEVWNAFEALANERSQTPVVKKWKDSQFRREIYMPNQVGKGLAKRSSSALSLPVSDAAELVREWIGGGADTR